METGRTVAGSVPVWRKYSLTVDEAADYFHIGRRKIRSLAEEDKQASWILWDGAHMRIKRVLFEQFLDSTNAV